jgi:hypothetical protein
MKRAVARLSMMQLCTNQNLLKYVAVEVTLHDMLTFQLKQYCDFSH